MYGVIFEFLRDYVIERHGGKETWHALLKANGHSVYKQFFPVAEYPDEEIVGLAQSAAEALQLPLPVVLEDFGAFTANQLLDFYHMYANPDWKSFEVIENASGSIHDAVHKHNPDRKPPCIVARRDSNSLLIIHYQSQRQLCDVVKGIVRGLGERFGESLSLRETQCMHNGAEKCIIEVSQSSGNG